MKDLKGNACKGCGEIIENYSLSGLCRVCWNLTRNNPDLSEAEKVVILLERHRKDLNKYHLLNLKNGVIPEHRYVWERHYNKKLPFGWVVHHLNGLKGDNRIENLSAMPKSDHDSKHIVNALKARIRELEEL